MSLILCSRLAMIKFSSWVSCVNLNIYFFSFFFCASRFSEYAIATACFTGLPALTSVAMFFLNASGLVDLINGI